MATALSRTYGELFARVAQQAREFGHPLLERANRPLTTLCEAVYSVSAPSVHGGCAPIRCDGCDGKLSPHRARRAAPTLQEAG